MSRKPLHSLPLDGSVLHCVALGLIVTLAHVAAIVFWVASPDLPLKERYHQLVRHDSYWFWHIIDHGYQSPIPPVPQKRMEISNVAFFPAFPAWGKFLIKGIGLDPKTGLLVAAELAAWGFWTYFLLLLRRWRFSRLTIAAATLLVLAHPAAFFLVAGYSESLFLMMLLGFLYWSRQPGRGAAVVAGLHGGVMTATRIAGLPAAFLPLCQSFIDGGARLMPFWSAHSRTAATGSFWARLSALSGNSSLQREFHGDAAPGSWRYFLGVPRRAVLMTVLALLGALSFFLYCKLRFGSWDFYMQTQAAGWGVHADYLALLKPGAYARLWPEEWWIARQVGQFSVPMTMLTFGALLVWEVRLARRGPTQWRDRAPLYFVGFVLFFIAVSGVYSVRLESMIRYQFCTHIFLVLALVHAFRDLRPESRAVRIFWVAAAAAWAASAFFLHSYYAGIFTGGGWVA